MYVIFCRGSAKRVGLDPLSPDNSANRQKLVLCIINQENKLKNKYKVVFLDWKKTLSGSKFWCHLENGSKVDKEIFERVEKSLFGNLRSVLNPWMRGELMSEQVMEKIATEANLSFDKIFSEFIEGCKRMEIAEDDVLQLVKKIQRKGAKVVIATDNMDSFTRWTVPALKLDKLFDEILNSHSVKALKGDFDEKGRNLFFADYLQKEGIGFGESVIVDDDEDRENRITNIGIEYRKIEPVVGLASELKKILDVL